MAKTILNDDYQIVGVSECEFYDALRNLDEHTDYRKVVNGVEILTFRGNNGTHITYSNGTTTKLLDIQALKNTGCGELLTELETSQSPMIVFSDGTWTLSTPRAIAEIGKANSLNGSQLSNQNEFLHAYLQHLSKERELTFITREVDGVKKTFAIRTSGYHPIKLESSFEEVIEGFLEKEDVGMYSVKGYDVSQDMSSIIIEFPYLKEDIKEKYPELPMAYTPGIVIRNNDLGYSTLNVGMLYFKENASRPYLAGEPVAAKHTRGYSTEKFLDKISENIWVKFTEMPEALSEATKTTIPASELDAFVEKLLKHTQIYKVFQKGDNETCKYIEGLREYLINTVIANTTGRQITAYDVIDTMMDAPDHYSVSDGYKELYTQACSKAWSVIT